MSDFGKAVTAVEMALKALHLDGQIAVYMDSETEHIVLDEAISIARIPGNWVTGDVNAEKGSQEIFRGELVEAVTEAVVALVAKQARRYLGEIFEAVENEDGLVD